jgi:hypothetical protein
MNSYIKKFLLIFAALMLIFFGMTQVMLKIIFSDPLNPNATFKGVGAFLGVFLPVLIGSIWYLNRSFQGNSKHDQQLKATGTRAKAEILNLIETGILVNRIYPVVKMDLKVQPPNGAVPFECRVEKIVSLVNMPRRGDQVQVAYDPMNQNDLIVL